MLQRRPHCEFFDRDLTPDALKFHVFASGRIFNARCAQFDHEKNATSVDSVSAIPPEQR